MHHYPSVGVHGTKRVTTMMLMMTMMTDTPSMMLENKNSSSSDGNNNGTGVDMMMGQMGQMGGGRPACDMDMGIVGGETGLMEDGDGPIRVGAGGGCGCGCGCGCGGCGGGGGGGIGMGTMDLDLDLEMQNALTFGVCDDGVGVGIEIGEEVFGSGCCVDGW
jgi:hypothetical protein